MKDNLPYFSHDNNARNHPKMKALIVKFGYEGYGRFWALNERIAETSGAFIDISRKINKLDIANELRLDENGLDEFLSFLSDPEIDLINISEGKITTDRINEIYKKTKEKRDSQRKKSDSKKTVDDFDKIANENAEIVNENDKIANDLHTDKTKQDKTKQDKTSGSIEPLADSFSQKQALELSELILKLHRDEFPDYLQGKKDAETVSRWAVDIEKLIRIDKKSPENIRQIIHWVKTPDNFWFSNIESGKKLREKFEKLWSQMQTRGISPEEKKARERERILQEGLIKADMVSADFEKSAKEAVYDKSLVDAFRQVARNSGNLKRENEIFL